MEVNCQRCHSLLQEADRYCPACGLPQLTYQSAEVPVIEIARAADGVGILPPQITPSGLLWRPALTAALLFALPAAVLSFAFAAVGQSFAMLWMIAASALAVVVYRRRSRATVLPAGTGVRIGLLTGLIACWLLLLLTGVASWSGRFLYHQGAQMDTEWAQQVEQSLQVSQQTMTQMGVTSAVAAQSSQFWRDRMLSPEGHAGMALFAFAMDAAFLLLFAIIGGAVGARFANPGRRTNT